MGLCIDILIDGARGSREAGLLDSLLQLILGRLHQGTVESATHHEGQCALGTGSLQLLASLGDGLLVARDDQLAGAIVVGGHDDLALLAHFGADLLDGLVRQADDGCHRTGVLLAGLLHGVGTGCHQPQAILETQGTAGHKRRELAERVAGYHARLECIAQAKG